jgi:DNA-binding MarR family transcriptional regulator
MDIVDELLQQWATEHPDLDVSSLGVMVRVQLLAKLAGKRTEHALRRHGLRLWEYEVLSVLRRTGAPYELPSTEIARAVLLTSGAMTTRIDGLEQRGLVRRRSSREDRRSILVRLTAKGRKLIDAAIGSRLDDANLAMEKIPARRRKQLAASLRTILGNFDP